MTTVVCALLFSEHPTGQQPAPAANVNVISGIDQDGDWTLQRQNEPSAACSSRNPQNCLVGANDYRTVDIPFADDAGRVIGDAWLGVYTTKDGGLTWRTRLLPGFPQDVSPQGLASPLKGTHAGADPVVRSGAFGMFFYSGITFNRGVGGGSKVFVARFIDHNDRERPDVDSIVYLDTKVIQSAPDGTVTNFFIDKPWLAVDVPRTGGGSCQISTRGKAKGKVRKSQSLPCARLFLSYTVFGGPDGNQRGTIMTTWSDNNGETWSKPRPLSPDLDVNDDRLINNADVMAVRSGRGQRCQTPAYNPALDVNVDCVVDKQDETAITQSAGAQAMPPGHRLHQGAAVAIAPTSGNVYIAWRQFRLGADLDALFISKSADGGRTYSAPVLISPLAPFDQNTTGSTFRSNAFPSLAIDDLERLYVAWTTRGLATFRPDPVSGDARVVVATSPDGNTWSPPRPVDNHSAPGHQLMPSIVFAAGQLQLLYYDQREDLSGLFGPFVDELPILSGPPPRIRHTTEVRAAHADPGLNPVFTSVQISDYLVGVPPGGATPMRLQYHPPNLPMFRLGTAPFMGDYIEIVPSQPMVQVGDQVRFNTAPANSPLFHAFWTDNRDVRPPPDGDWTRYTPPNPPFARPTTSRFDPSQSIPQCTPGFVATRNQNIYTARVSKGLVAAALTNSKQLSATLSRSFPVYIQNNTTARRSYRMTIRTQPPGGRASFDQFTQVATLDLQVPARSTAARSVHVTSSDPRATVPVDIVEITAPGGSVVVGGQSGEIVLNPDRSNPDVSNPDVDNVDPSNPDVDNPDVDNAEVFNPDVDNGALLGLANPDVDNPDVDNPDVDNVLVVNPSVVTADPGAPDVSNPDVDNPDVDNPDVDNADLINGGLTDTTWTMTNRGNTAASYAVKLLLNRTLPPGFRSQLIVHRIYQTPAVLECELKQQTQNVLLVNLPDPSFATSSDLANPDVDNPDVDNVTVAIPPGESIRVTLRVYDPNRFDKQTFDAVAAVTPVMVAHSVDTVAVSQGETTPDVSAPLLPPAPEPPAAPVGGAYSYTPPAPPTGPGTWSIAGGSFPPGLTLNTATGAITGTATASGEFMFVLRFVDGNGIEDFQTLTISVAAPAVFANVAVAMSDTPDPAVLGSPLNYSIVVSNAGPAAAAGVTTTQTLPLGATLVSATPSQGSCAMATTLNCTLGSIASGGSASIAVVVTTAVSDFATSTITAASSTPDPGATDNTASTATLVQPFAACVAPTFSGPRLFATGIAGNFVVSLADFTSDGNIDALSSQSGALTLLPGDGNGAFGAAVTIPVAGTTPSGLAVGDFNEDGDLDVVVSGSSSDVLVLLGTGAGTFTAAASIPAGFASFVAEPGDFNNDGNLDVIVGGTTGQMAFVAGNGDGTFDAPVATTIGTGIIQFVVADFNNDGRLDAAASDRGTSVVTLRTGDGAGGFTLALTLNPGAGARLRPGLGDINNDGNADLSVTIGSAPSMQSLIYLGNGAGGFAAPIDAQAGGTAQFTSAADINGDGVPDLVAIHPAVGKVGVQLGAGGPAFGSVASFATAQAVHFQLADINGDLKPDIVLATGGPQGGVSVLLNNCSATPADLAVVAVDAPDPIAPGAAVTYSMTVSNNGPNPASDVLATAALQNEPHIVSATASQGTCSFIDLQATCDLGTLAAGASATVSIGASSSLAGSSFRATLGATAAEADPNAGNSAVTVETVVSGAATPTITNVGPSSGQQGGTLDVAITGQNTNFVQGQTTASFGIGLTVNTVTVTSPTTATVNIAIDPTATTGARNVTLTTGAEIVTRTSGFTVAPGPAAITQLSPNAATRGETLTVQITGQETHFLQDVTTADFGPDITVNSLTVTSATSAAASVAVAASAAPGTRTVTLTTLGEVASNVNGFTVQGLVPLVTGTTPSTAQQGQTLNVVVAGQNTSFQQDVTTANFGAGVLVNGVTVASPTSATVNVSVDPIAAPGNRAVQMTTGTEIASGAVFSIVAGPAVLTQITPNSGDQGETVVVNVTGQGTHFAQGVTTASLSGAGVTPGAVTVTSATAASVSLTIDPLAAPGARTVTLTTEGEQAQLVNGFTVIAATPVIVAANPGTGQQNTTLDVVVTGQFTNFEQGVTTASFGAGITVNSVTVTSLTSATVNITINPLALTGSRTITLTTGAESAQSPSNAFTVLGGNASLAPLSPASGQQGATLDVTITGNNTHFSQALSNVSFGAGIVVNQLVVTSATTATANISVLAQAAVGSRTVVVTTAGEIAERNNGFAVTAGQASIVSVNPPTGRQAETLDVQVAGQLTNFVQGSTTASFGAGIIVNSVTVTSLVNATVKVTIDPAAALGSRTVTMTTGSEVASSVGGFTVLAGQPTLLSVNPIVGTQGDSITVVLNGAFTNFTQGVTTASFGSGISVGTVTVNGPGLASVPITISEIATAGPRSVSVVTGTEVATLVDGFTVAPGTPALTLIDPNIGRPDENTTVTVTGVFTSFQQGVTVASFGTGVSVNGAAAGAPGTVTVTGATQFTAQLAIAAGAQLGPRNVVVQTGPETLTTVGGFTVTDVEAIPPSVFKVSPANSATDVPLNARIQVEFSEPIDRTTVTPTSFVLRDNTTFQPVPANVSVDVTGRVATLIPSQLLAVSRSYAVLLSAGPAIRDASGNAMPFTSPSFFTTGFATDTAGPSLLTTSIADGDSDVPLNADVVLEFTKPINPVSQPLGAQVQLAGVPVPGTYTFSAANQVLTFQPADPLTAGTLYTVVLSTQLTDAAGNSLANPGAFSFTTGTVTDGAGGTVVASNPTSGASGVGVNTRLRATFSERIDPVSVSTGFVHVFHPASGRIHPAAATVAGDRRSLTLTTSEPLRPETSYTFQVFGLRDLAGNFFNSFSAPFTTAAGLDVLAPTVTGISPAADAIDVPVNVHLVVEMSEAIDPTSVPGAVQLAPAATGTLTLSGGTTLTFVPAAPLAASTQYEVTVSGLRDLAGHTLPQPFTSTFTTRAVVTADTTPPTVVQTVPGAGATGVAVSSPIVITISEPVVATAVDENSVRVLANVAGIGFVQVAGTLSADASATVITFTPLTPYPGATSITLQVNANSTIDDLAGNNLTFVSRTFTTAAAADTTPPAIVGVMPLSGTINVGLNAVVTLTFSESLAPNTATNATFAMFANGQPHPVSVARSSDNRTVMLNTTLPADSVMTVVATSGVTDLAGNELADFTSTFATTSSIDTTIGHVVTVRPASGAVSVPATTPLTLFVSKPVNATTVPPALWVAQNGVLVTGAISISGGGTAIHFVPTAPFAPGAFVQVFLEGAVDQSGNAMPSFQASFTIASNPLTAAPTVLRVAPMGTGVPINAVAEIEISEPIDPATATPANVRLLNQSFAVLPSTITLRANDRIIRLEPDDPLAAEQTTFIQVLSGLEDLQGQPVSGGLASFTTGSAVDSTAPTVTAVTPPDGVGDIGTNALVRVSFSEPVNPLTVSGATIQVMTGGFVAVPASFSFNPGDTEVTLMSVQPLPDAAVLTITIAGVQDRAGQNVIPLTTTFTTRTGADTRGPTLLRASVFGSQTGVPVNSVFVGEFDEPLDSQSVSGSSVVLRDNIFFVPVPAAVALNPDGRSITVTPTSALAVGRSFSLFFNFNTALRDLAGNNSPGTSLTFVTSFQPDVTAPAIIASNPVDGDLDVPTNVRLKVLFDEAIDANTLDGITLAGGAPIPVTAALSNGNRSLAIGVATLLAPATPHTLTIAGLRDTSGNQIAAVAISFTTGAGADLLTATVVASNPDPNDTDVGVNVVLRAVFSERIDPTTVATGIVRVVHPSTSGVHPTLVSVAADRRSLTLTPAVPLLGNRQYSFQIFGLLDVAGNPVSGYAASFVTASAADATPPTVASIAPAPGAADVPVNAHLVLRMSEAIDPTSLPGAVQLTPGANGTLTLSTDGTTLTFVPLNPLAVSTSYGVAVTGLRDLAGNMMTAFASTFTTRALATADVTAPTVLQTVPVQGATGVAVDSAVTITISEPIVASAVNADSVRVLANVPGIGFVQVAGSYGVNPTATVITFNPLSPYPGDTQITVQINANSTIDDLAGNNLTFVSRTFTTAPATDTTPPTIVSVMPLNGTVNVGLNAVVTLTFSESLAPATVNGSTFQLFAGAQRLNPSVSRSSDNRSVTLTSALPPQALITVVATSGVTDLAGNALADFTSTFVTGATVDTTIGHVVTMRPASGATNVPSSTSLTLYLTKPAEAASVAPALWVSANGVLVSGTTTVSGSGTAIHFVPTVPFAPSAFVQVFLEGAQDFSGNVIQSFQASFTIASNPLTATPTVVRVSPTGSGAPLNAVVEVEISEAVNPATVSQDTIRVFNQTFAQIIPTSRVLRAGDRIIRMVPAAPLNAGETYFIQILSGLQDLQGQGVSGGLFSFVVGTAADAVAPTVEAVSPPDGAASVGINAQVRVRFSEPINPLTVSGATIQVSASGFTAVPASISFNPTDTEVTVTPLQPLPDATAVTISLSGVEDRAGQSVTPDTATFTTRTGADTRIPTLTGVSVFANQIGVPVNSVLVGEFDEELDPLSVTTQSVALRENLTFQTVPVTVALNPDGRTITVTPGSTLVVNRSYTVFFNFATGLRDLVGNQASGGSVTFTTSSNSDTTPPTVLLTVPNAGLADVSTNARIQALFDEPIDATQLEQVLLLQGATPLAVTRALSNGNRTLTLTPPTLLAPDTPHTLVIAGVPDTAGNLMAGATQAAFTTGAGVDLTAPVVTAFAPPHNTSGVPVDVAPQVTFNEAIDPLSVTNNVVLRLTATGVLVPVTVGFSADYRTVTLTPLAPLASGTQYTIAVINFSVRDLAGNVISTSGTATFVTQ